MGWFDQSREIARLKAENVDLRDDLAEARDKLFSEIDANREREAALMDQVIALAGVQPQTPSHELLIGRRKAESEEIDDKEPVDLEFERQVSERAADYAKAALDRGIEYDAVSLELLKDRIRQNPADYLDN